MNGRRAILGLCMLCALLISAFAAQSASAVTNGTTAFTCKDTGAGKGSFTGAHCKPSDAGSGNFSHVAIAENTTTEAQSTSQNVVNNTTECGPQVLKATIAGVATELSTCTVTGEGWMENKLDATGEHYSVSHGTLTYTNVKVTKPAGCKVYTDVEKPLVEGEEGVIHTKPLKITTKGQGSSVRIEPTEGNVFATFILTGCAQEALNKTYEVTGSITCKPDGATINCLHNEITTQATLKLNGTINAGYNGSTTTSGRLDNTQGFTPLSTTNVQTP